MAQQKRGRRETNITEADDEALGKRKYQKKTSPGSFRKSIIQQKQKRKRIHNTSIQKWDEMMSRYIERTNQVKANIRQLK